MDSEKKKRIIYLSILFVLVLIYFYDHLTFKGIRLLGDMIKLDYHVVYAIKNIILNFHQFPLWSHYHFAGMPFLAMPQTFLFTYFTILLLFLPAEGAINMGIILTSFFAGVGMFYLMTYLKLKPKYAFLSAFIYVFNTYFITTIRSAVENAIVYAFLPFSFLFILKAIKEKEWVKNSIFASIFLAIQFHGSGLLIFVFLIIPFSLLFIFHAFGKNFKKRVLKLIFIGSIVLILTLGLSAIKFMPLMEFEEESSKQQQFNYEEGLGHTYQLDNFIDFLRIPLKTHVNEAVRIGLICYALLIISLIRIKNKNALYFWILAVITILIAAGTRFYYPLWRFVPGFDKIHHVARSMYLFAFAAAALCGIGASTLFKKLNGKFNMSNKKIKIGFILVFTLMFLELFIFEPFNYQKMESALGEGNFLEKIRPKDFKIRTAEHWGIGDFNKNLNENELLQYIVEDKEIFRINSYNSRGIGGYAGSYTVPLELQILYGSWSLWIPEYFNEYLGVAWQSPPKFWGMLNVKYVYSKEPLNISEFNLVKEFDTCESCVGENTPDGGTVDGPYLYLNKENLPRAYFAENSILVIGQREGAKQTMYALMLNEKFNPSNSVIIMKEGSINSLDIDFLNRFTAIILIQGSIDQSSIPKLNSYVNKGGILIPNVIEGENSFSENKINDLLSSFKGSYESISKADITKYSPNKIIINAETSGFLILSEKFFMFDGWKTKMNKQNKEILRANGINSAVYIEEQGEITFYYSPKSFKTGAIITILTLVLIIFYLIYRKTQAKLKV